MPEKVIVLDFGGQFNQLIARRVREAGVYCEIQPYFKPISQWFSEDVRGIILTGGPNSVYAEGAIACSGEVFSLGVPVLGICYGMQLIASMLGGRVESAQVAEFGHAELHPGNHPLFKGVTDPSRVWMNHLDRVTALPEGFSAIGWTEDCQFAAMAEDTRRLYGVQFHPEVNHSDQGRLMLRNFVLDICGCRGGWKAGDQVSSMVEAIRAQVGEGRIIAGFSGGVDSSVASVLCHKAVGDRLTCVLVDHGLMRENEVDEIMAYFGGELGLRIHLVDAKERFLAALAGVTDPETKRKIIGREFVRVFEEASREIDADYLMQGTIYPDVIESGLGPSATIKSHHNVGGLPKDVKFKGLVEPLRALFKDEVREVGESLGIPENLVWRQPFPGPGLAVRILGDITEEKLNTLRRADAIYREEIAKAGLMRDIWQYFAVYTGVKSVGVMGDRRTYDTCIALRAVTSTDAMTVEAAPLPYDLLGRISNRIINEVDGVNRVVYDITSKPPGTIEWE